MHSYKVSWLQSEAIADLPFCRVYPEEYILTWNGACIPNFFVNTYNPPQSIYIKIWHKHGLIIDDKNTVILQGQYYMAGSAKNYFHFLYDVLPRFQPYINNGMEIPILTDNYVVDEKQCFQRQYLDMMGIDGNRLVPLSRGNTYLVESLICYSTRVDKNFGGPIQETPSSLTWVRDHICKNIFGDPPQKTEAGRKIFVSRADCTPDLQRLSSHNEIAQMFADHGFEIVVLRGMSAKEQVTLFSEASVVAGPHGAGLANTIFSRPGTKIIELSNSTEQDVYAEADCYWRYSSKHLAQSYRFESIPIDEYKTKILEIIKEIT